MSARRDAEARQALERFEALLDRADALRVGGLSFDALRELGRLYRRHSARLAQLRDRDDDPDEIHYLNSLCVRAYSVLYGGHDPQHARGAARETLADALARTWRAQLLAWGLLGVGVWVGAWLGARDDLAVYALSPAYIASPQLEELLSSAETRSAFFEREETSTGLLAVFGSFLFVHNTRIGLLAFASGMLAGIPTLLLQLYNGMALGAFASIFLGGSSWLAFLAWILPHGIPELTAITLSASAGLVLGAAVAAPGRLGRRAAIRRAAPGALLLFGAAVPLFYAAALIESFVRESTLGTAPRLVIAAGWALLWVAAVVGVRRLSQRRRADTRWLRDLTGPPRSEAPGSGSAAVR